MRRKKNDFQGPFYIHKLSQIDEIISEVSVMKWYKTENTGKGKLMFMEQMKKFIEWLQSAEEETDSE